MWCAAVFCLLLLLQKPDAAAEGLKALEDGNYDDAARLFTEALQADPNDYAAHFHLALANSLRGRHGEAAAGYAKVLELKPGLFEARLNLGMLRLKQGGYQEAAAQLEAAAEQRPQDFRPLFHLAEAHFALGRFAEAERRYQAAAAVDPKSAAAWLGLGRALARQNRLDEAASHFRKAAELDGAFKEGLLELAALYEAAKNGAAASELYALFPDHPAARERLGELLLEAGRAGEAAPHLEFAAARAPTTANRFALATAYLESRQPEKGLALLEQVVQAEPNNAALRLRFGRVLRDQRDFAGAAREFHRAAQLQPERAETWNELAGMLILVGNYPQALAALDRVRALGAETAAHHYFRALALDRLKQHKPALESYQQFLVLSNGKSPEEEFKARQRVRVIKKELGQR